MLFVRFAFIVNQGYYPLEFLYFRGLCGVVDRTAFKIFLNDLKLIIRNAKNQHNKNNKQNRVHDMLVIYKNATKNNQKKCIFTLKNIKFPMTKTIS